MSYSESLFKLMSTHNPVPSNLIEILSPLLEDESSQVILKPLCPTEHGSYYVTARRPGLCLSVLKERISSGEYLDTWVMLMELVILLEDSLRYSSYSVNYCIYSITSLIQHQRTGSLSGVRINPSNNH